MIRMRLLPAAVLALAAASATSGETPSTPGTELYFIGLEDGATLQNPVTLHFGLKGMGIAPAGVEMEGTGHHHLLINATVEGEMFDNPLPADDNHIHFGGGQTETTRELPPGTHTIQLILGDHNHIPHDPPVMSERIQITVE
ncbi:MAG: DUF4399 domain-containing protein [Paracoccaceae bacterium]